VLLGEDRSQLEEWEAAIKDFLATELALELNSKARRLQPVSNGVNFLGYIIQADYLLVRKRVIGNLHQKLKRFEKKLVKTENGHRIYSFDRELLGDLFATVASYLGHFKHANSFKLVKAIWQRYSFLSRYFLLDFSGMKLHRKSVVPGNLRTVKQQYGYFQKLFADDIIFFQVGRFFEFYHSSNKEVAELLNLAPLKSNKRDARFGFPVHFMLKYLHQALSNAINVMVVLEGEYLARIKERKIWRRYEYESGKIYKPL
jgi:RNA-directed DNA polymerase